jgi:TonB family protein
MARSQQTPPVPGTIASDDADIRTSTASAEPVRERDVIVNEPGGSGMMPLVAIFVALAFGASAWFFYHQGENDGALDSTSPASASASAADNAAIADANSTSNSVAANGSAEPAAETTTRETASYGNPDIVMTVHPNAAQMQAPAAKPRLAKATRAAPAIAKTAGINREVALVAKPHPLYPAQAMRAHEQGTVMVLAQVDVNGHVSDTRVVKRSGSTTLDRAASNEVRGWKFSPALHNGQAIMASVEVPVSYRLDQ